MTCGTEYLAENVCPVAWVLAPLIGEESLQSLSSMCDQVAKNACFLDTQLSASVCSTGPYACTTHSLCRSQLQFNRKPFQILGSQGYKSLFPLSYGMVLPYMHHKFCIQREKGPHLVALQEKDQDVWAPFL